MVDWGKVHMHTKYVLVPSADLSVRLLLAKPPVMHGIID